MKKLIFALSFCVLSLASTTGLAFGSTFLAQDKITVNAEYEDDVYLTGQDVVINKDIRGDLFVAAGRVELNSNVYGDLFVTGGTVILNGKVADDIRIIAAEVNVNNNIGSDAMLSAGKINIASTSQISGDLTAAAGVMTFAGEVGKKMQIAALNFDFNGVVKGDADFAVDKNVSISETSSIGGNLSYYAIQKSSFPRGVVKGDIQFNEIESTTGFLSEFKSNFSGGRVAFSILNYLSLLLLAGLLVFISPKYVWLGAEEIRKNTGKTLATGLIAAAVFVFGSLLLTLTVIGLPIGMILFVLGVIVTYFGRIIAGMWLGAMILRKRKIMSKGLSFGVIAFGLAVYWVFSLIPFYIGFTISVLFALLGLGATVKMKMAYMKQLKKSNLF